MTRRPAAARADRSSNTESVGRVPLRLTAGSSGLGMELYETVEVGPLDVRRLSVQLPNLKFPVDLSGGVPSFRHRRGVLDHVALALDLGRFEGWLGAPMKSVLGPLRRRVSAWGVADGLEVGAVGERGALAFRLLWAPAGGDVRLVVCAARAAVLTEPALAAALRVVDAALPVGAVRRGRIVELPRAAQLVAAHLFPSLGARVPGVGALQFEPPDITDVAACVTADALYPPASISREVAAAIEGAALTREADDALAEGRNDQARAGYMAALEAAPRQRELSCLIAGLDAATNERTEAALGLLTETLDPLHAGRVGALLLEQSGDTAGAYAAWELEANREAFAPLAALHWLDAARVAEPERRGDALDEAVGRAPASPEPRWARLAFRVSLGDVSGALEDGEQLEAAAVGHVARHTVSKQIAEHLHRAGYAAEGGRFFERSLRYLPDDPEATAGLGRSLLASGSPKRAVALLERSLDLGEQAGVVPVGAALDLARILADEFNNLPHAIARVRTVQARGRLGMEARALEAQWRAQLGDIRGATVVYDRLRQMIEHSADAAREAPADVKRWLLCAARHESEIVQDQRSAERHLYVLLQVCPDDEEARRLYRQAAASPESPAPPTERPPAGAMSIEPQLAYGEPEIVEESEADVDALIAKVQANPADAMALAQLAEALEMYGRDEEIVAVLSAAYDEGHLTPSLRQCLVNALGRLADAADQAGDSSSAELMRLRRDQLASD